MRGNIFRRWVVTLLGGAAVLVMLMGVLFYRAQKQDLIRDAEAKLEAIARLKVDQITAWRAERLADAAILANSPLFIEGVEAWLTSPSPEKAEPLLARFSAYIEHYHYSNVLLVDVTGKVLLRYQGEAGTIHPDAIQILTEAIQQKKPLFVDLHVHLDDKNPHLAVIAPLFQESDTELPPIGAVILQYEAEQFLYPMLQAWPTPSPSAETLLVRRDGGDVLFLNELRHQAETALALRIPLSESKVPAVMAALGREGVVHGVDYRGIHVVSVLRAIPDSPWHMVAKMDEDEIYADWRFRARMIILLTLAFMAALIIGAFLVWQRNEADYFKNLAQAQQALWSSEERNRITLMSIGDGVITTDASGNIEFMNPVAETLTGWKLSEAAGRSLEEVFRIINEESRETVENPVNRVLREGVVVGLANHTLLISKDGTERPIADSGAPIRVEQGAMTGVVLVFRDQSEERATQKQLQEREEFITTVLDHLPIGIAVNSVAPTVEFTYMNDNFPKIYQTTREALRSPDQFWEAVYEDPAYREEIKRRVIEDCESGDPARMEWREIPITRGGERIACVIARNVPVPGESFMISMVWDISDVKQQTEEKEKLQEQLMQSQKMEAVGRLAGGVAHDYNNMLTAILGHAELAQNGLSADDPILEHIGHILDAAQRSAELTRQLLAFARKQTIAPKEIDLNEMISSMLNMLGRLIGEDIGLQWKPTADLWPVNMDPAQVDQILVNLIVNARDAITGVGKIIIETGTVVFDEEYCQAHHGFHPGEFVLLAVSDNGCGMNAETIANIFEPFFTTKPLGQGTGLGLATVYGIVKQNNGFINVYSEPGQGTTVKIYLPRAEEGSGLLEHVDRAPREIFGGTETVLLVEDEAILLQLTQRLLEQLGYHVLSADRPAKALEIAREYEAEIQVLITDVVMPEMSGRDLWSELVKIRPSLKCLFVSGYTANVIAHQNILDEGVHFLQKPFTRQSLADKVREVLEE